MQENYIYVSFAEKDLLKAQKLIEKLQAMGIRVLFDQGEWAGSEWAAQSVKNLKGCNCLLLLLTENSADSQSIRRELDFAISQGKQIITVRSEDVALPAETSIFISFGTVVSDSGDADRIAEELCKIDAVKECFGEKKGAFFQTGELPPVSAAPELPSEKPDSRCPVCGQTMEPDARFCHCCGSARGASATFSAPPPPVGRACPPPPSMGRMMPSVPSKAPASPSAVVRKKSLSERIRSLLSGNKMTDVNFSVLTPAVFEKENYTMVDVYAYEEEFRHVVEKVKAERAKQEGEMKESDGGHLQIKKGAQITVRLSSPDLEIADNEESRVWSGKYVKFDFPVFVPKEYEKTQILFCADVYFDSVIATRIRFVVSCVGIAQQRPKLEQKDVHSAFISYASGDRERVALILQGMRRSRPDLDVFFDVETLKTGESWEQILRREIDKRDILYLCWSPLARESEWVDMEWRYALKQKGPDGIEPIPLALPKDCPPPEELKGKHFGARELYYQ